MPLHEDGDSSKLHRHVKVQDPEEIYEAMMAPFQGDETLGDAVLDLETGRVIYSPVKEGWGDEEVDEALSYPKCVKAKGVCPPEDSGGPWAYMEDRVEGGLEGDEGWSYMEENLEPRDQ